MAAARKNPKKTDKKPWWKRPTILANIIFVIAFIGIALHFGKTEQFGKLLTHIDPWWIGLAVLLQIATYLCFATLLVITLRVFNKKKIKIRTVAGLSVAKLFVDQVIPTLGVGGSFMIMQGLIHRDVQRGQAMAALVTETISRWICYFFLFAIALVLLWYRTDVTKSVKYISIAFSILFVIVISAVGYLVWSARQRKLPKWIQKRQFLKPLIDPLKEVPGKTLRSKHLWVWSFFLQMAIFLLDAGTLWACLHALGATTTLHAAFISFMMASAIATISLIPGGLGFFEGVAIGVLASLGTPFEAGVASTVLLRGLTYWIPMIPGFFLFHKEMRHQEKHSAHTA